MNDLMKQLADVVGEPDKKDNSVPYWLPTCLPNVNLALSGDVEKGFPGGRLITISGPESSGKTALATEATAKAQGLGGFGFLCDYEHAFDHGHAERLGVDPERFYSRRPDHAEEGFEIAYRVMQTLRAAELKLKLPGNSKTNPTANADAIRDAMRNRDLSAFAPIVGIMDSVAAMIPRSQDVSYEDQNMKTANMSLAALLSIELKRLARDASATATTMILLNQLRTNPGIMFGDNKTEPGGESLKYYASVQLRLRRVEKLYQSWGDDKSPIIGDVVEMFVRKNKVHRPFQKTRYVFRTVDPVGLDPVLTMIYLGKNAEILGPVGGKTIDSTTFLGAQGSKRHGIAEFEDLARSDAGIVKAITDYVMGKVNPVVEGKPAEEDEAPATPASVFAGLKNL